MDGDSEGDGWDVEEDLDGAGRDVHLCEGEDDDATPTRALTMLSMPNWRVDTANWESTGRSSTEVEFAGADEFGDVGDVDVEKAWKSWPMS